MTSLKIDYLHKIILFYDLCEHIFQCLYPKINQGINNLGKENVFTAQLLILLQVSFGTS